MHRVTFSNRIPGNLKPNVIAEILRSKSGYLDLTESNPTHAGIEYPESIPCYEPEPFGLPSARALIAAEFQVPMDRTVLTASTSEAYSWLFKLFCNPGDEVLVPRPSYPLFEYLAALESVRVRPYGVFYDHGWHIDFHTIHKGLNDRTRAIVVVNPNNPTGHFVHRHEVAELCSLGLPIISDEVFRDYVIDPLPDAVTTLYGLDGALVFALNGLSKTAGLPQMKLGWMTVSGPVELLDEAFARLEIIADTYLSLGTPVQLALPELLKLREPVQRQILTRVRANLTWLQSTGLRVLHVEAGWYAIVAHTADAANLLRDHAVLVQPGYFYDFERDGYLVVSLLTPETVFRDGIGRLLRG